MARIKVKIENWSKHNPRKDYKRPVWFAVDNRMIEDPKFYGFTGDEFKAWIYILSQASQKNSDEVELFPEHSSRVCGISEKVLRTTISKLESNTVVTSICTDDERDTNGSVQNLYSTNKQTNKHTADSIESRLAQIFQEYPRRDGDQRKAYGLKKLAREIKTPEDFESLSQAVKKYHAYCAHKKWVGTTYVKQFGTWVGNWREWNESQVGNQPKLITTLQEAQEAGLL